MCVTRGRCGVWRVMRWWRVSPDCADWLVITAPLMGHSGQSEPGCQAGWPMRARHTYVDYMTDSPPPADWLSRHGPVATTDTMCRTSAGHSLWDFMKTISCLIPDKWRGRKFIQIIVKLRVIPPPTLALSLLTLLPYPSTTSQVLSSLGSSLTLNVKPQRWPWDGVWNGLSIYPPTRKLFLSCSTL